MRSASAWPSVRADPQSVGSSCAEILLLVVMGVAIGVPVTPACSRLVTNMLFGIRSTDAASVICSVLVLLVVGLLSGWGPARRASHTNPMEALRHE